MIAQGQSQENSNSASQYQQYLESEHPYRNQLQPIFLRLPNLFQMDCPAEPNTGQTPAALSIYIKPSPEEKINTFCYHYTLPLSLAAYVALSSDTQAQKKLDTNIANYDIHKEVSASTKVMYLSYKGSLLLSSRDFVYVRHEFTHSGSEYWVVTTSLPDAEEFFGTTRGRILVGVTRARQVAENKVEVSTYSEVDMKIQLKPEATKAKGVLEIKRYVERVYKHASSL